MLPNAGHLAGYICYRELAIQQNITIVVDLSLVGGCAEASGDSREFKVFCAVC